MPISTRIRGAIQNSSWIRRMFEEGAELKARLGPDQVYDFTLGNPDLEPPPRFQAELVKAAGDLSPGLHAYMPNAGLVQTRHALAGMLSRLHGLEFKAQDVVLTCGASGGLNVILKALLDPGDEVVVLAPYFPEYLFYADNHGGVARVVETDAALPAGPGPADRGLEPPDPGGHHQFAQQSHGADLRGGDSEGVGAVPGPPCGAPRPAGLSGGR